MEALNFDLNFLGKRREIAVVAVQLLPPELEHVPQRNTLNWKSAAAEASREELIKKITASVFENSSIDNPDVLIFPEYSVPAGIHTNNFFQNQADKNNCMIVAGSYFETLAGDTFRHNVCPIYIPSETNSPIYIAKDQSSPEERDILSTGTDVLPNVARLIWTLDNEEKVSISIFICRDYLAPFKRKRESARVEPDFSDRISLLDWEREGLNIVIMNNKNSFLFEGAAGLDVRETHGKRKLVLFANAALGGSGLATALLGPSADPNRTADVIAKVPTNQQGLLVAKMRLWDVHGIKTFPDTHTKVPVSYHKAYILSKEEPITLSEFRENSFVPTKRGVWHPAFLEAANKKIVMDFLVAKSFQKVEKVFNLGAISNVKAGLVRGTEDVMVRRYEYITDGEQGSLDKNLFLPSRSDPFNNLTEPEFYEAFEKMDDRSLQISILPRDILKFRGAQVGQLSDEEWTRRVENITKFLSTDTHVRFERICSIAEKYPENGEISGELRDIFFPNPEDHIYVGLGNEGSHIRETYVLISVEASRSREATLEFQGYIDHVLIPDNRIREIFRIQPGRIIQYDGEALRFNFIIKMKCTAYEADLIVLEIHKWGTSEGRNLKIGTRTYDLWHHLIRDSVRGLERTHYRASHIGFIKLLLSINKNYVSKIDVNIRNRCADAVENQRSLISHDHLDKKYVEYLQKFYANICFYNAPSFEKDESFVASRREWQSLYHGIELLCHELLQVILGLPKASGGDEVTAAIKGKLGEEAIKRGKQKDRNVENDAGAQVRILFSEIMGYDREPPWIEEFRARHATISRLRNATAHGTPDKLKIWRDFIDLSNRGTWIEKFDRLSSATEDVCYVIKSIHAAILDHQGSRNE